MQSYKTAIVLGAARGAAIVAAAEHGLPIYEYPPRRVKQAVVGRGGADKQQVAFMVRALLELTETPPPDAADALAIGLAHFYANGPQPSAQKRRDARLKPARCQYRNTQAPAPRIAPSFSTTLTPHTPHPTPPHLTPDT